ncbi:MAG: KamA family radical SAM protein [bacterium]|nr:KamA family radical SAM protein [bacterium]
MATSRRTLTGSPAVPLAEVVDRLETGKNRDDSARLEATRRFPVRWTRYYLDLIDPADPADPIRRIAYPEAAELESHPDELADPVGERDRSPQPYIVRKHADRAILLTTSRCHVYCRFCFRRSFPDGEHRDPSVEVLDAAIDYLARETDLREVILSGGDPLTLPDDELRRIVGCLAGIPHLTQLRIHTRAPVHDPARIDRRLVEALTSKLPTWVVLHFNHPREITSETRRVVSLFLEAGMPVLNQTVLLAGVNDDASTLEALCRGLLAQRIKPYYLHHPDRVPGAGSFYIDIERGKRIYGELTRRLGGGLALPAYVIDPPDGSGKVPVG